MLCLLALQIGEEICTSKLRRDVRHYNSIRRQCNITELSISVRSPRNPAPCPLPLGAVQSGQCSCSVCVCAWPRSVRMHGPYSRHAQY
jgi:hypothetical protein